MSDQRQAKISVLALTLYPPDTVPGQRYRFEQWKPFLREQNIEIDYFPFADAQLTRAMPKPGNFAAKALGLAKGFLRRLRDLSRLREYDVIFIYRAAAMIGPALLERIIKISGRPVVYDFDDAIFLQHTNEANRLFSWLKFSGKTASICRLSTAVTVGNAWLAEYARKFNSQVTVIPSSVNTDVYAPQPKRTARARGENGKIIVGWTGSSTSQTHLEMFAPTLEKLFARHGAAAISLHVHSDRTPNLPVGVPFVWHPWSPDNEVEVISQFDIGIMPLPDDEWSRGKCSMKALLYMSLGIPTVCSDVGMNREVVAHGENGLLAASEAEWLAALDDLIADEPLRDRLGAAARQTVLERYSMKRCAEQFGAAIRSSLTAAAAGATSENEAKSSDGDFSDKASRLFKKP